MPARKQQLVPGRLRPSAKRPWPPQHDDLVRLVREGAAREEIAAALGRTIAAVESQVLKLGGWQAVRGSAAAPRRDRPRTAGVAEPLAGAGRARPKTDLAAALATRGETFEDDPGAATAQRTGPLLSHVVTRL